VEAGSEGCIVQEVRLRHHNPSHDARRIYPLPAGSSRDRFAAGATEGFNNKARITTRKAYGFRTYEPPCARRPTRAALARPQFLLRRRFLYLALLFQDRILLTET